MAAVIGSTQLRVKKIGSSTTIPDNPTAKLMFYFNCVCTCIEADDDYITRRLQNYNNYSSLSSQEEAQLLILCLALSPNKLIGSIFLPASDNEDFGGSTNRFYELIMSAVSTKVLVSQSLLVGGQQKKVRKIMKFKKSWIEKYYINPLRSIERRQRPAATSYSTRPAVTSYSTSPAVTSCSTSPAVTSNSSSPAVISCSSRPAATNHSSRPAVIVASISSRPAVTSCSTSPAVTSCSSRPAVTSCSSRPAVTSNSSRPTLPAPSPPRRSPQPQRHNNSCCTIL